MQSYPIYINNRDRLTTTRQLAEQCSQLQLVGDIFIVDNDSSYPPLLDWYESCPYKVVRLKENLGPRAPWALEIPFTYYVVTDNDLDMGKVPKHVLDVLRYGLDKHPDIIKVGVSLEIDDIPDMYPLKWMVLKREAGMWESWERDSRFHLASIDTTFAMYRPGSGWIGYNPSLRVRRPYTARHLPWYVEELDEEERYYLEHLNTQGLSYSAILHDDNQYDTRLTTTPCPELVQSETNYRKGNKK